MILGEFAHGHAVRPVPPEFITALSVDYVGGSAKVCGGSSQAQLIPQPQKLFAHLGSR